MGDTMWQDYKPEDLICVQARHYKGSTYTLVKIATLFGVNLDTKDEIVWEAGKQEIRTFIVFCVARLTKEEREVLFSLLAENLR